MNTRISRRRFLTASAATATAVALSACGATPTPTQAPPTATKATAPTAAPAAPTAAPTVAPKTAVELIVVRGMSPIQPIRNDAPAHLEVTKLTNVKMNFQPVPLADWLTKMQLWMSTQQVPDIMHADFRNMRDYASPSVFKPLLPLIDKYAPNLKKLLEAYPDDVKKLKMNGDLFVVPMSQFKAKRSSPNPCIREDLMAKLGMKLPTTFDELYNVLKELKKANPSVAGWTARQGIKRTLMIIAYPYGSGLGSWAQGVSAPYWEPTVEKGKWLYGAISPEFKDVLAYFAKLYKEGLVDPDIANTTADQWHEKNSSGKGVFTWDNFGFCTRWNQAVRGMDPKATWAPFATIKGTKGARQNDFMGFGSLSQGWTIGANCKYPERAIELMDWMVSPAGIDLRSWGIEGIHYTLTGTRAAAIPDYSLATLDKLWPSGARKIKPDLFDQYKVKADAARSFQGDVGIGQEDFCLMIDMENMYSFDPPGEADAWYTMVASDKGLHEPVKSPSFTADESGKLKKIQTDVDAIIDPVIDKLVLGQSTMADWDKAVEAAKKAGASDIEKIFSDAEARA